MYRSKVSADPPKNRIDSRQDSEEDNLNLQLASLPITSYIINDFTFLELQFETTGVHLILIDGKPKLSRGPVR